MPGDGPREYDVPHIDPPNLPRLIAGLGRSARKIFLIVGGALVVAAIVAKVTGFRPPWPPFGLGMSVSEPALIGNQLTGTFNIHGVVFGIDSDASGGACLIADIADLVPANDPRKGDIHTGSCTKQADCNPNGDSQIWSGYCAPSGKNLPNRCWYKPADNDAADKQLCQKSAYFPSADPNHPHGTPWDTGVDKKVPNTDGFDLQGFYRQHTGGKAAQWRVTGLLWGTQDGVVRQPYGVPACMPAGKC